MPTSRICHLQERGFHSQLQLQFLRYVTFYKMLNKLAFRLISAYLLLKLGLISDSPKFKLNELLLKLAVKPSQQSNTAIHQIFFFKMLYFSDSIKPRDTHWWFYKNFSPRQQTFKLGRITREIVLSYSAESQTEKRKTHMSRIQFLLIKGHVALDWALEAIRSILCEKNMVGQLFKKQITNNKCLDVGFSLLRELTRSAILWSQKCNHFKVL